MRTRNLREFTTTLSAILLVATMLVPGIPAYATDTTTASSDGQHLLCKEIASYNEYTTYQGEKFTYTFTQEGSNVTIYGETANTTKVSLNNVTITLDQNLGAESGDYDENVRNSGENGNSSWTRTMCGNIDLSGFNTLGIYTYTVKEYQHNGQTAQSQGTTNYTTTGNNSLAHWVNSKAEYQLRIFVEDVGSDQSYARDVEIVQTKDNSGNAVTSDSKKPAMTFSSTVTAPTLTLTKNVDGAEQDKAKSQGYPFKIELKGTTSVTGGIQYLLRDGSNAVNLSEVKTVGSDGIFYLKKDQTAIFINLPAGDQEISKLQEEKTSSKDGSMTAAPDLGVKDITYDVYYEGTRDNNKSSQGGKEFSQENSLSNIHVEQKGTVINWTNIIEPDITPTGVVTSIAPYVTLVLVAGAAVAAYIILKNRMR